MLELKHILDVLAARSQYSLTALQSAGCCILARPTLIITRPKNLLPESISLRGVGCMMLLGNK